ncbi:MAG: lysozyme inhibitor LprI family protein [Rhizobiaceae bacterium]|jgi:uncharacterized protein YecT (DUF1311 family)|nr:lysozyme inhibitor LprI family protein [Rhizobiaceae bacterium]
MRGPLRPLLAATGLMLLAAPAWSQDFDCGNPDELPQQGMALCADQDFRNADAELNRVWRQVRDVIQASEREYDGYAGWFETLRASQRAWIGYRDSQCEAEGYQMAGGSAQGMLIFMCLARLTRTRTEELRAFLSDGAGDSEAGGGDTDG